MLAHVKGPDSNYLGIDIHAALVQRANSWAAATGKRGHVHYHLANAMLSAERLLCSYPGCVSLVSIQYPDPHIRRQRHMVGEPLVRSLAAALPSGGRMLLASDFEETAAYMRNAFECFGSDAFGVAPEHLAAETFPCSTLCVPAQPQPSSACGQGAAAASQQLAASSTALPPSPPPPASPMYTGGTRLRSAGGAAATPLLQRAASAPAETQAEQDAAASLSAADAEDERVASHSTWASAGWLVHNPVGAPTEREVYVEKVTKGRVYRVLLKRR